MDKEEEKAIIKKARRKVLESKFLKEKKAGGQ